MHEPFLAVITRSSFHLDGRNIGSLEAPLQRPSKTGARFSKKALTASA
jgi:hypothetical protein